MAKIIKVTAVYHLVLDDGTEATTLRPYKVGDECQAFFDNQWGVIKVKPLYNNKEVKNTSSKPLNSKRRLSNDNTDLQSG